MRPDELFSSDNENVGQTIFSVTSTRAIEVRVRTKDKCNRLACDIGSLQSAILIGLSDRFATLAHELLGLEKNTIIPVQGFNLNGRFLIPIVDLEIVKDGFCLDEEKNKLLHDIIELFFMMATSYSHRSHQGDMFNKPCLSGCFPTHYM